MNTYNDLCNKILNEYQIEQTPNQPENPIIPKLMDYLKNSIQGFDPKSIDPGTLQKILDNKQQEEEEVDNVENTQQQPVQNIPNNSVKSNIVSNIPVQNKNIQKKI